MNLTESKLKQLNNPDLTPDQRTLLRCQMAAEFTHAGHYEAAREALGHLWQGIGQRPEMKGLSILTTAEVLLQCGVLSGWLGSVRQTPDAQEKAKDLLSEALRVFQSEGLPTKASEAQYELGLCYFRLGAYDDARVILEEAFNHLGEEGAELKAMISIRRASVEIWAGRYYEARRVLEETKSVFDDANDVLRGKWHGQIGLVFRRLATTEGKTDYFDNAIIEYTAAIHYYEQAHHERYCATNLNNLAFLLYKLGRYTEAHEHLDRASRVLRRLRDDGLLAQVSETRARVFVAEKRYREANRIIADVIKTLEKGGEHALLADALAIQGVVWARLGFHESSLKAFRRAITIARDSGASSHAGLALLTLIEEHGAARLSEFDLYRAYRRADGLLRDTQDAEEIARLRACARIVTSRLSGAELGDKDFSLPKAMLTYEAKFIAQALEIEEGSVSRAAKRLGIKHQTLAHLLRTRHKKLLGKRTPPIPRRRSIIKKPKR
jgi:tetratricopeptide (TPR) repeat protein